jgi:predicted ATP-dependent endonuclease of OLD family
MIGGLFLRNYKTYENFNFISFLETGEEKLNLFIGNNGAGKSSILEALDTFFNDREFILSNSATTRNSNIAPVFLIKKEKLNIVLSPELKIFVEELSKLFWDGVFTSRYSSNPKLENFVEFRDKLKLSKDKELNYLFLIGFENSRMNSSLITVQNIIESSVNNTLGIDTTTFQKRLNKLFQVVRNYYKYIYIPVETSIDEFLKIEAEGMQSLMDKNLKNEIEKILNHSFQTDGRGEHRASRRHVKIVEYINEKIVEYVEGIEVKIQEIEEEYHFNREVRTKKVAAKKFAEVIIDTYFSTRRLQRDSKDIKNLSAGERKKALIDIAYTFLSQNSSTEREVIFAIDEPESSLHISMCYEQYKRIENIANLFNKQVFVTTHWYGGLPILNNGRLYYVNKISNAKPTVDYFSLENYFETRRDHPDDINLKSFYDLTSSIISSVRNNPTDKWLIVEGLADKKYIEHYLGPDHDYHILPVGGCSVVKKLYEYLFLPLSQNEEDDGSNGRIYCLIDTDSKAISVKGDSQTKNKILYLRRLQLDENQIKLLKCNQGIMNVNTQTEMEESLNPNKFYLALKEAIEEYGADVLCLDGVDSMDTLFSYYDFDTEAKFSFIRGEETFLKSNVGGRSNAKDLKSIHSFFDKYKDTICNNYIKQVVGDKPQWLEEVILFLDKANPVVVAVEE